MKAQYELKGKSPRRQKIERTILFIMLLIFALFCFTPFYIMIINSTQSNADLASKLSLIPGKEFVNNYNRLGDRVNIWVGFKNSIFISTLATIFAAYFGALTAYGFSKFNFKGKNVLFAIVLGALMIPPQLGMLGFVKFVTFYIF